MKSLSRTAPAWGLALLAFSTLHLAAAEPLHFRGQLRSSDGSPSSGKHQVTLRVYDRASLSGAPLWSETRLVDANREGQYTLDIAAPSIEKITREHKPVYVEAEPVDPGSNRPVKTVTLLTTIPQGIWFNCNPDNGANNCDIPSTTLNTESAIKTIAAARFRYILNADNLWGTEAQLAAYANQAHSSGLRIIWYLGSDFSTQLSSKSFSLLSSDTELPPGFCTGCSNAEFVSRIVSFFKKFPATAGYMIDDEEIQEAANGYPVSRSGSKSAAADGKAIAALAAIIRAADATHPIYGTEDYAAVPNASEAELAQYYSYIPRGTLDSIGLDYYPVGSLTNPPTDAQLTNDQKTNGDALDTVAHTDDVKETFEDLQAYNWTDAWEGGCQSSSCAFPTIPQLQDMLAGAVTTNTAPAQVFWWEYTDVLYNKQWNNLLTAVNPQ